MDDLNASELQHFEALGRTLDREVRLHFGEDAGYVIIATVPAHNGTRVRIGSTLPHADAALAMRCACEDWHARFGIPRDTPLPNVTYLKG